MSLLINLTPLLLLLVLLFTRCHMLIAALAAAIMTMFIGNISIETASGIMENSVAQMLELTIPILYAAAASMVSKAGSVNALIKLAEKILKNKTALLAGVIVLIQGFASYMAGMAAGNTMVTAPLMLAAVGAVPGVIAAMAVVSAVGITTSPASTETILAATSAGRDVLLHARIMMPITILFYMAAALFAVISVHRHKGFLIAADMTDTDEPDTNRDLLIKAIPAIGLLLMVLLGQQINGWLAYTIITPPVAVMAAGLLTVVCTSLGAKKTANALIDGSTFILKTLFTVGLFLSSINLIGQLGTFEQLAAVIGKAPGPVLVPASMLMVYLISIPAGAMAAGVLALTLPTLVMAGIPPDGLGFVAIATGLGCMASPVQINIVALSEGFKLPVMNIVRNNIKYTTAALILLMIIAMIVV